MLTRFHKVMIGLMAVQLVLAVIMMTRGDDAAAAQERPLLPGFDAAKVTRVVVTSPTSKVPIDLVKKDANWVLASHFDYPVDATKMSDLLSPLAKMAAAAPVATSAARHKQLRVGDTDHERKLLVTVDGKEKQILVGGSAGSRRTAVRIGNDVNVFGAAGLNAYQIGTEARQWVDPSYVKITKEEVAKVLIEKDGRRVEISRPNAQAPWTATIDGATVTPAAGESLDTNMIDSIVNAAINIDLKEPGDPKKDASKPTATITIDRIATDQSTPAPTIVDVILDGDTYWVRQRGMDRAIKIDKARLDNVLGVEASKLVKKDPPPDAAGSASAPAGPPGMQGMNIQGLPPGMAPPPTMPPGMGGPPAPPAPPTKAPVAAPAKAPTAAPSAGGSAAPR